MDYTHRELPTEPSYDAVGCRRSENLRITTYFTLFISVSSDLSSFEFDSSPVLHLCVQPPFLLKPVMSAPQKRDITTPLPVNEQKDVESQSNSEPKRLEHPLLYDVTPPTVLVDFDSSDDPYLPMNWPFWKKVRKTFLYGFTTCWITFASAVYSTALG